MSVRVIHGDCLDVMKTLDANFVDSVVTDPPYGLSFMGKGWDHGVPGADFWTEALRVAKPGAHLLAFGGTRTHHRLMVAIEGAGWDIRDVVMWVYGSGFPKSLNVQQAINKATAGHPQGGVDPTSPNHGKFKGGCSEDNPAGQGFGAGAAAFMEEQGAARGDDEGPHKGWGTALKPAWEPIILARKPLIGTVAENVLQFGTGGLNIDGCRVEAQGRPLREVHAMRNDVEYTGNALAGRVDGSLQSSKAVGETDLGRWPGNLIHDGSEEVLAAFPDAPGQLRSVGPANGAKPSVNVFGDFGARDQCDPRNDVGSAARFFYCAKASREDRNEGLQGMSTKPLNWSSGEQSPGTFQSANTNRRSQNHHPTVKPTDLMRYLCRLVTPKGGTVLDPFMGSGSTGRGAIREGFNFIGIELDAEYCEIARIRIHADAPLFAEVA